MTSLFREADRPLISPTPSPSERRDLPGHSWHLRLPPRSSSSAASQARNSRGGPGTRAPRNERSGERRRFFIRKRTVKARPRRDIHGIITTPTNSPRAPSGRTWGCSNKSWSSNSAFIPAAGLATKTPSRERFGNVAHFPGLQRDYRQMGMMIFGDPPDFKTVLDAVNGLEEEANDG